ncbi:SDR family oxidoreductase [Enterococcus sp. HY326]|uniref:SDR family oxidoreductase n=1 Tax=Enterococcus sp. HY326 TaxID=2971265 RepID=UPI00223F8963|nr:SDR family oxidoreductase [Enterococcus sp. HY326]
MKKIALVTGASSGMGLATATALAKQNIHVVMLIRNYAKGLAALAQVKKASGGSAEILQADLGDLQSLERLANKFQAQHHQLDILVNNAGVLPPKRQETHDGFEEMFGVHYLGHFAITNMLMPQLLQAPQARIVNVASLAYRFGEINFADLNSKKHYSFVKAYSNSKLAVVLFTEMLAKRLRFTQVTANSLHPGIVNTSVTSRIGGDFLATAPLISKVFLTPEKGAETAIMLATDPALFAVSGKYFDQGRPRKLAAKATDLNTMERLWSVSESLVQEILPDFKAIYQP